MRVIMLTKIGGFRNGEEWPDKGAVIDVPDHEARDLILARYARQEAPDAPDATTVDEPDVPAAGGDDDGQADDVDETVPEVGDAGELDGLDKRALIALAAKRGIEVNPRWGATRLRERIAKA